MVAATVLGVIVKPERWSIATRDVFGGVNTEVTIGEASVPDLATYSKEVIIDGLSVRYTKGGGGVTVLPALFSEGVTKGMAYYLDALVTTATVMQKHWCPLGIPIRIQDDFVSLVVATTALDVCQIGVWGHYTQSFKQTEPMPPTPVTVDSFKWPLTRRY